MSSQVHTLDLTKYQLENRYRIALTLDGDYRFSITSTKEIPNNRETIEKILATFNNLELRLKSKAYLESKVFMSSGALRDKHPDMPRYEHMIKWVNELSQEWELVKTEYKIVDVTLITSD